MDNDDDIKDAREFWKEKARSVEKSKTAVTRSRSPGFPSVSAKNGDKLDEAKRRNNEELVEVLRQRRQSSSSPEPCVTSPLKRSHQVRPTTAHDTREIPYDSKLHDRWKRTTVTTASRVDTAPSPTPTSSLRSTSPLAMSSPYKVMCTHDSSTVATKMAERINSLKKVTLKPHPPLRPASSVDSTKRTPVSNSQLASLKKRPFSTSVVDINNSPQHSDNDKNHLQLIMDKVYTNMYYLVSCCDSYNIMDYILNPITWYWGSKTLVSDFGKISRF